MKERILCITLLLIMIIGTIPISAKDKKATKWIYDTTGILTENEDVNRQIQDIVDRLELEIDNKVSGGKNIDRYFIVYSYNWTTDGYYTNGLENALNSIPDKEYPKNYKNNDYIEFYINLTKDWLENVSISVECIYSLENGITSNKVPITLQEDGNILCHLSSMNTNYGLPLYEILNMPHIYRDLQKKQSSNKGKLYISEYGFLNEYPLYLDNLKISNKTTIGDIIKNTKYKIYSNPEPLKKIDNIYSSELYENAILYLSKDKIQTNTRREEYIENYYPLKVYSPDDNFYELGNMYFNFTSQYSRNIYTLINTNDYYIKKVFSIKNAPKLKSFRKDFIKKVSGEGKNDIVITKLTNEIGYSVQIPMCSISNGIICPTQKLILTYYYNSNGKCIKINWRTDKYGRKYNNEQYIDTSKNYKYKYLFK